MAKSWGLCIFSINTYWEGSFKKSCTVLHMHSVWVPDAAYLHQNLVLSFSLIHSLGSIRSDRSDQLLSRVWLLMIPWITTCQASLSITNSRSSLRLMSIESVMPSSHLILLSSPSPPAPNPSQHQSFPMSQLVAWGGQSTGISALASFLPKKSQGWSPSEWTGWISLQSKGLSRVFSNTTVQRHQFFGAQPSSQSNSHIHTWPQEKP